MAAISKSGGEKTNLSRPVNNSTPEPYQQVRVVNEAVGRRQPSIDKVSPDISCSFESVLV